MHLAGVAKGRTINRPTLYIHTYVVRTGGIYNVALLPKRDR